MAYLSTNPISLSGQGSVTNGLRDIKPPVDIPNPWAGALWAGAVLFALAAGFLLWRYYQKRKANRPAPPLVPPHVRARQKLEQALEWISQPKPFCIAVSDITRVYLEERFAFRAPERTTEEFLYEMQSSSLLTAEQKRSLGDFLQRCDLVKFAKYEPGERELRDLHSSALRLVDETVPAPMPAETGTLPGATSA